MSTQRRHAAAGLGVALVVSLAAMPGCLRTDSGGTCYRCSTADPACPSGQSCIDGVCRDPGGGELDPACAMQSPAPQPVGDSCAALQQGCGSAGGSCCEIRDVPGGMFYRSYDGVSGGKYNSRASNQATISNFRLDRYEVTVGRFRAFVRAHALPPAVGAGAHAGIDGSGWLSSWQTQLPETPDDLEKSLASCGPQSTWTTDPGANENRPINCITWYEAMAFCIWDGGYLPTEAEWNYAAAGGGDQRAYPWSVPTNPPGQMDPLAIDGSRASYAGSDMSLLDVGSKSPAGDGRWGHADLAGNVWEWTLDAVPGPGSSDDPTYPFPCTDCAILDPVSPQRLQRGGAFDSDASDLRTGERAENDAGVVHPNVGMRCARPALMP